MQLSVSKSLSKWTETWPVWSCLPHSTSETRPMGCQRPRRSIVGPKCTVLCRGRARTGSRSWWRESGPSVTFRTRWSTSGRWVETKQSAKARRSVSASHHKAGEVDVCVLITSVRSWFLRAGERLPGAGERTDVRAVWRNAAVDGEAFTGNQGNGFNISPSSDSHLQRDESEDACVSAGGQLPQDEFRVRGEDPDGSHGDVWSDEQFSHLCKPQPAGNESQIASMSSAGTWIMDYGLCSFVLQKSLLENCQNRVDTRGEVKSLRSTFEKTQEQLRDKERELAAAQAENQTLKLQVICPQERFAAPSRSGFTPTSVQRFRNSCSKRQRSCGWRET